MPVDTLTRTAVCETADARPGLIGETAGDGTMPILLITPGWGTGGYYSEAAIKQAGENRIWAAGTHMYVDHPKQSDDEFERPARTIRDLCAVLTEDTRWDDTAGGLVAQAKVYTPYRGWLDEMREDIGVSIRAYASFEYGEAEGRSGPLVKEIVEGLSVDFVTKAGRGGRILQVMEAARTAATVAEATANETREALHAALVEQFGAEKTWIWVRDYDDSTVWYQVETPDSSDVFALDYSIDEQAAVSFSGSPVEVRATTTYVPVADTTSADEAHKPPVIPAGSTTQESQEDTMTDAEREAHERQLAEANGRATAAEAKLTEAETRANVAEARLVADRRARTALAESDLPTITVDRVVEAATRTAPLKDGALDEAAFDAQLAEARTAEETYLTSLQESAGAGTPRGLGADGKPTGELSESDLDKTVANAFGRPIKEA